MKYSISHIGAPDGQNRLFHEVITFVFQRKIMATPGNPDKLTCLAFRNAVGHQEAGPRPSGGGRFFVTTSYLLQSIGLGRQ